jgi:hypothetical protein
MRAVVRAAVWVEAVLLVEGNASRATLISLFAFMSVLANAGAVERVEVGYADNRSRQAGREWVGALGVRRQGEAAQCVVVGECSHPSSDASYLVRRTRPSLATSVRHRGEEQGTRRDRTSVKSTSMFGNVWQLRLSPSLTSLRFWKFCSSLHKNMYILSMEYIKQKKMKIMVNIELLTLIQDLLRVPSSVANSAHHRLQKTATDDVGDRNDLREWFTILACGPNKLEHACMRVTGREWAEPLYVCQRCTFGRQQRSRGEDKLDASNPKT